MSRSGAEWVKLRGRLGVGDGCVRAPWPRAARVRLILVPWHSPKLRSCLVVRAASRPIDRLTDAVSRTFVQPAVPKNGDGLAFADQERNRLAVVIAPKTQQETQQADSRIAALESSRASQTEERRQSEL
jgi:hypothetical protein